MYDLLRDDYGIQAEFGDMGNMLAIVSVGDDRYAIERLVASLSEIKRLHGRDGLKLLDHEYITPVVRMTPQEAFYAESEPVDVGETVGKISAEFVMCYPPGIPILAPGEEVTEEALDYILYAKEKGCLVMGPQDMELKKLYTVKRGE